MEAKPKSQIPPERIISLSSSKQKDPELDEEDVDILLTDFFNAAIDEMEAEKAKDFNFETSSEWSSIRGKSFFPKIGKTTDIGGSFCINPTQKNATIPISSKVSSTMPNGEKLNFTFYGLFSNYSENLTLDALYSEQKQLIGRLIAKFLKKNNPKGFSDLGIYKALEETLASFEQLSKKNNARFSATFTITLQEKLWVAHAGSSAAFLSNQGDPYQLSINPFSIINFPLEEINPCSKLILVSGDVRKVASCNEIVKGEYEANKGFSGANNGSAARQIACAAHAHAAKSEQDIAVLIFKLTGEQGAPSTNKDTEFGKLQIGIPQPAPKLQGSKLRQAHSASSLPDKDIVEESKKSGESSALPSKEQQPKSESVKEDSPAELSALDALSALSLKAPAEMKGESEKKD